METISAVCFYLALAALVGGGIRVTRANIERQARDRIGLVLIGASVALYAVCVVAFLHSDRRVIPF